MRTASSAMFALCLSTAITPAFAATNDELAAELAETRAALKALQQQVELMQRQLTAPDPARGGVPTPVKISAAHTDNDLEPRVTEIEDLVIDMDERVGSRAVASAFDAASLDIGGFFDSAATVAFGEGGTEAAFNRQVFELLLKAELGEKWDLFVAQAFVRNSPLTFSDPEGRIDPMFADNNSPVKTDTVIALAEYAHSNELNVQMGRFITPAGIINVEHFPASLLDPEQPMFLRPFPGQSIFANFTNGVNVHGSTFSGSRGQNKLSYNAWGGVWAGNATNAAFGGRLAYTMGDHGLTVGLNATSGDRSRTLDDDRFYVVGGDVLFDKGKLLWKSEVFYSSEGVGDDKLAYYTQPAYRITPNLIGFYRYDYFDNGAIGGESVEHVAGISFNPVSNVRLRGIYRHRDFKSDVGFTDANADIIQFSSTFNF